ncbi:DNA-binding response regulator, AraC family [Lachnospiraceae bacterium KM106-2]|nr:DNA-binding response regulator, AraC family [Lachnospiraceae bacterium KM106-2]
MFDKEKLKEDTMHGSVSFPIAKYEWTGDSDYDVNPHWHQETELLYLEKGIFTLKINLESYEITAPAFVIINSGEIHSIALRHGQKESAIVFSLNMLSFEYFDALQYKLIHPLLTKEIYFPRLITPNDSIWKRLQSLYENIFHTVGQEEIPAYLKSKIYLYELLGCLYENDYFHRHELTKNDTYKIESMKSIFLFIHHNYQRRITLSELASTAGMNEQYFCRYFKKMTGKTVTQYLNDLRIDKAAAALIETDKKVIDIAILCGYDNIGYFIKRFTQAKGLSPSKYRTVNQSDRSII